MKITSGHIQQSRSAAELEGFSFHRTPVLVVENFWSVEERSQVRAAMQRANWNQLQDLSHVRQDFPNSGNWAKAEIAQPQGQILLSRLQIPCIHEYIESFPTSPAGIWGSVIIPMVPATACSPTMIRIKVTPPGESPLPCDVSHWSPIFMRNGNVIGEGN